MIHLLLLLTSIHTFIQSANPHDPTQKFFEAYRYRSSIPDKKEMLALVNAEGFDVNAIEPSSDRTPLCYAAHLGDYNACRELIDRGAYLNYQSVDRRSANPLVESLWNISDNPTIKGLLMRCGARLTQWKLTDYISTPIAELFLAEDDIENHIKTLKTRGHDREIQGILNAALRYAAIHGRVQLCQKLMHLGALPLAVCPLELRTASTPATTLHLLFHLLQQEESRPGEWNAQIIREYKNIIRAMIKHSSYLTRSKALGLAESGLELPLEPTHIIMDYFIEPAPIENLIALITQEALAQALKACQLRACGRYEAQARFSQVADINGLFERCTLLGITSQYGSTEAWEVLIRAGANVNDQDQTPYSVGAPIHRAAFGARPEMCTLLIEHKVEINAQNSFGETALDWAYLKFNADKRRAASDPSIDLTEIEKVIELLKNSGAKRAKDLIQEE